MAISKFDKYGVSPERAMVGSTGDESNSHDMPDQGKYNVDLSRLDIHVLTNDLLIKRYNENNDDGIIRSFFKRLNIKSQDKRLGAMLDLVKTVREHSDSLIEYKAHLATQQKVFEIIADGKIQEARLMTLVKLEEYETLIATQRSDRKKLDLELDNLKIQNDHAHWEAEKAKYDAGEAKQNARITELRGDLISKIIGELNFADINMKQVFVLIEMVKETQSPEDLLGAEAKWEQMKAEARKAEAQADQEQTKADYDQFKFKYETKEPVD